MRAWILALALAGCWERELVDARWCDIPVVYDAGVAGCRSAAAELEQDQAHCGYEVLAEEGPMYLEDHAPFAGPCCYKVTIDRSNDTCPR
jgi:hypothetical protein